MLNDGELCPEYIAAIVGVVQSNVCITCVCVCQTTAYTDGTPRLSHHQYLRDTVIKFRYAHARANTHAPRRRPSESEIMDIPLDPILSSHRGTRNAKKATTLLNIVNLLTKNYTRRLYMNVMSNETYVDVKSNIIYHKHWQMWG